MMLDLQHDKMLNPLAFRAVAKRNKRKKRNKTDLKIWLIWRLAHWWTRKGLVTTLFKFTWPINKTIRCMPVCSLLGGCTHVSRVVHCISLLSYRFSLLASRLHMLNAWVILNVTFYFFSFIWWCFAMNTIESTSQNECVSKQLNLMKRDQVVWNVWAKQIFHFFYHISTINKTIGKYVHRKKYLMILCWIPTRSN